MSEERSVDVSDGDDDDEGTLQDGEEHEGSLQDDEEDEEDIEEDEEDERCADYRN